MLKHQEWGRILTVPAAGRVYVCVCLKSKMLNSNQGLKHVRKPSEHKWWQCLPLQFLTLWWVIALLHKETTMEKNVKVEIILWKKTLSWSWNLSRMPVELLTFGFFFKPNWGWTPNSLERFVVCRRKTSGGPPIRTGSAEISPLTLESLDTIDSQNGGKCYYCYLCCFAESIWFNFITEESDGVGYALEGSSFPYSFKHRNPLTVFAWETRGKSLLSIWIEFTTKTHLYPPRVNKILRFYINQLQLKHYLSFSIHSQLWIVTKERPRTNIGYED